MVGVSPSLGLLSAVLSALFNGSFTAPFKAATSDVVPLDKLQSQSSASSSSVHPIVFTLYVSVGVFLSSWLVVPFLPLNSYLVAEDSTDSSSSSSSSSSSNTEFHLSFLAIVSGWLFVLGIAASFVAVDLIGMALAQGVWAGSATVISYFWGTLVFAEEPSSPAWSGLGLLLLVAGVVGIAFSDKIGKSRYLHGAATGDCFVVERVHSDASEASLLRTNESLSDSSTPYHQFAYDSIEPQALATNTAAAATFPSKNYTQGVLWACAVGLFGGSILAPVHYLPPHSQGLLILPSFGIGALSLAPLVLIADVVWTGVTPPLRIRKALGPGLLSGLLWNVGNFLSIIAIPSIGYGVAYPLLQGAVLVSGIWGIYVFREIQDRSTINVFWFSGAILLLGAATLAVSQ